MTVSKGIRQSTYETYLKPILNRKNLTVLTSTNVNKILFSKNSLQNAIGVDINTNGSTNKI